MDINIIRQALEGTSDNSDVKKNLAMKIAKSSISENTRGSGLYCIGSIMRGISDSSISDEDKNKCMKFLKESFYDAYNQIKKYIDETFGQEKKSSVEDQADSQENVPASEGEEE